MARKSIARMLLRTPAAAPEPYGHSAGPEFFFVTWSVNSLCHVLGTRPFTTRRHDRATNLCLLALVSFGESGHNMHHSDPACARRGADRGPVDISAGLIRIFEHLDWATGVR
jgi:stearoyl-CoA desaturase (delta-9 desaturase)